MGWSCRKNRRWKTGKESRSPDSGEEMETRTIEIAMRDCIKSDIERVGREWKKLIDRRKRQKWKIPNLLLF